MKTIVLYSSKGGNTQKVADEIASELKCESIGITNDKLNSSVDLNKYDSIKRDDRKKESLHWQLEMNGWNYPGGQFTILNKDENESCDPRILFGTYWDGVMAIGSVK